MRGDECTIWVRRDRCIDHPLCETSTAGSLSDADVDELQSLLPRRAVQHISLHRAINAAHNQPATRSSLLERSIGQMAQRGAMISVQFQHARILRIGLRAVSAPSEYLNPRHSA